MSKHEFLWDGRGERGDDARFSFVAGRAATDMDLTGLQMRILLHLGRFNGNAGWCRLNQTELARWFGVHRQAINDAIGKLVKSDYVERRTQAETGESFCHYRAKIDGVPSQGVSGKADTGVSAADDTPVRLHRTPVSAHKDTLIDHVDHVEDRSAKPGLDDGDKRTRPAPVPRFVSEEALDKVRHIAPGWDRQMLLHKFLNWEGSKTAERMDAAFLGWVKSFTKGKAA